MASDVRAQHLIIDLIDVPRHVCLDLPAWKAAFNAAAIMMGMRIVDSRGHLFEPPDELGLTAFTLLDSSHFSVHTYADRGQAAVDLFACTQRDLGEAWTSVASALGLEDLRRSSVCLDRFVEERS